MNVIQLNEEITKLKTAKNNIISSISSFGVTVPDNVKFDEISYYIDQIEEIETIIFYISSYWTSEYNVLCEAKKGMTFGAWVCSDYCTDDIKQRLNSPMINIEAYRLMDFDMCFLYNGDDSDAYLDDVISDGADYYFSERGGWQ